MAMIVMIVLVLASFLSIESKATRWAMLATRARLNATMSARLALGHLQQAAGPDIRSTATGELACKPDPISPYDPALSWAIKCGQGQRYWTGAWRTDKPDEPPQWLISGKGGKDVTKATTVYLAQSISLSGETDYKVDATHNYWAPWQRDYPITYAAGNKESYATLVGNGSAVLDPGPDGNIGTADDIDGRIALPKIPLPGPSNNSTTGNFAYWIGDEGVKAAICLTDPRDITKSAPSALSTVDALRAPGRTGTELLLGLKNVNIKEPMFTAMGSTASLSMLPGYDPDDPDAAGLSPLKLSFHHQSLWTAGVLADSYRGGLRKDLSLAFEMDDAQFDISDFGSGNGHETVIEAYTADPILGQRRSWFPSYGTAKTNPGTITSSDPFPRVWVPMYEDNTDNLGRKLMGGTQYLPWCPVFIRGDEMGQPLVDTEKSGPPTVTTNTAWDKQPRRLVGPLWHLVRDYYRLYKDVDWTTNTPSLGARSFFPNTNQFVKGGYRLNNYARYDLDDALWSGGGKVTSPYTDGYDSTPDPLGWVNGLKGGDLTGGGKGRFIPRPVRGAYMPTVHRLSMVFSLRTVSTGTDYTLKLVCTPVLVIHNPYNVQLKLKEPTSAEPDPRIKGGLKISFSQFDQMRLQIFTHTSNDPAQPIDASATSRLFDSLFNFTAASDASTGSNAENLVAVIPATTLEPGEFAVFTSKQLVDATTLGVSTDAAKIPILNMERGFYYTGGFYTDIRASTAAAPYKFKADDTVKCCIDLTSSIYWHHWLYLTSGWKKSLKNDIVGQDLGSDEVLGTSRNNSLASYAHYVNVGGSGFNATHLGDAGSPTNPVIIGPVSAIRTVAEVAPGPVIAAFDTRARVADTARTTTYDRSALSYFAAQSNPVPAAHPAWLFTNPLPQTSSNPALNGLPGIGMASQRTQLFGGDELALNAATTSWSNFLQIDATKANGANAFGGSSHGATGIASTTEVEVPLSAPVSLGQLMHANLSAWDWMPYRTVGNSFPSMVVPLDKSWTHGTPHTNASYIGGHTFGDMSYLMNNALWDSFFFSGAAPTLSETSRSGSYNAVRSKSLTQVMAAFAAGTGKLSNPRMSLYQGSIGLAAQAITADGFINDSTGVAPDGYRRFSSYLLNLGAFNVNSTSVEAWTGLYGSLKGLALGSQAATAPSSTNNARFPRIIGSGTQTPATRNIADAAYWNGFANLSDTQIRALATATVTEIKARAQFLQRTERDQEYAPASRRFRGFPAAQSPGTPFLGLCEFVNRYLGPTKKPGAFVSLPSVGTSTSLYPIENQATTTSLPVTAEKVRWMFRSGTLESAIARADKALGSETLAKMPSGSSAKMIDPSVSHNWMNGGIAGARTGMPPGLFFRNVEILDTDNVNRTHNGFGANGCLFQGDLLQALGPVLATRSDTFRIRAYGEANDETGTGQGAVLELVVQRTPDYLDPANLPHDRLRDSKKSPINVLLGRRFIILSFRWLATNEI
ncbi:MAG: hypothetical protein WCO73_02335 [Verrucomicrobiota bacterium]